MAGKKDIQQAGNLDSQIESLMDSKMAGHHEILTASKLSLWQARHLSGRQDGKPFAANKSGAQHRGGVCNFIFTAMDFWGADTGGRARGETGRQLAGSLRQEAEAFSARRGASRY
jgi:hypothetical protein